MIYYSLFVQQKESQEELEELRGNFKDGQVLGNDSFLDSVRKKNTIDSTELLTIEAIIKATCSEFTIDRAHISSHGKSHKVSLARAMINLIAVNTGSIPIDKNSQANEARS